MEVGKHGHDKDNVTKDVDLVKLHTTRQNRESLDALHGSLNMYSFVGNPATLFHLRRREDEHAIPFLGRHERGHTHQLENFLQREAFINTDVVTWVEQLQCTECVLGDVHVRDSSRVRERSKRDATSRGRADENLSHRAWTRMQAEVLK